MLPLVKRASFVLALSFAVTLHAADYTYQQTTQLTGGSLLHMMKSVGFMSSQARHMGDPVVSSIYLKDNRLANVSAESIEIMGKLDDGFGNRGQNRPAAGDANLRRNRGHAERRRLSFGQAPTVYGPLHCSYPEELHAATKV